MSLATTPIKKPKPVEIERGAHHQRLEHLRDREQQRRMTIVVWSAVVSAVILIAVLGVIDFQFEIGVVGRLIGWLVMIGLVIGLVMGFQRWLKFDSVSTVGKVERARPELGQRLRTSHDYKMNPGQVTPADPELVRALEFDTQLRVSRQQLMPIGAQWPVAALLCLGVTSAIVWAVACIALPEWRVSTARLAFLPLHYSNIQLEPIPESIRFGEDLVVRLHIAGRPLKSAFVRYRSAGEIQWSESTLQPSEGTSLVANLSAVVPDCRGNLEIQVRAGWLDSGVQSVIVKQPLVMEQWTATLKPPSYTGLPTATGSPAGLRIPEGSELNLAANYNRRPASVDVEINPEDTVFTTTAISQDVATLTLQTKTRPIDLVLHALSDDGMSDDSSLHLEIVADRRPTLKFLSPAETSEAISTAELRFTLQGFDDYGLTSIGINYRIDDGPEQTLWEASLDEPMTDVTETMLLPLEELKLIYPQAITYYAYATDNRHPESHRITSDLRFVDIRPFSREYEFSDKKCSGNCQGECLTLEKLIKQQREILGRTFAATQQQDVRNDIGSKLADQQRHLREQTESLTEALMEKIGPIPSLTHSMQAMSNAIEDLAVNAIVEGQNDEEDALAELIASRQNLRKILKQSNSQAKMCRNVDQQQIDKIRKPEQKKDEEKEQQLSSLRQKLDQLAKEQQSFCQSAKACEKPGQSNSTSESASGSSPSRNDLAQQQEQATDEAQQIQQQLSDGKFGSLAPKRVQQAAAQIKQSGDLISEGDDDSRAIQLAEEAAKRLQDLSDYLAKRHAPDFGEKLLTAGRQAEKLAEEQDRRIVADHNSRQRDATDEKKQTRQQSQLADDAEQLADLVDQILAEAIDQDWQIQRALTEQLATAAPREAANEMRDAATLHPEKPAAAAAAGARASRTLKRFATAVEEIRQAMGPVRLGELTQAEQQAAALLKELRRASTPAELAMVQAATQKLSASTRSLGRDDPELAQAAEALPKLAAAPETLGEGLRKVDEILQRRIQEAILSGAMQQSVGAVPPQYTDMVEAYYRVLSEDVE
ncbi:DUF4175 family protein [Aporhodopirellula aestuarii]|uniref:DUF4175 family protein n=1 Tax=Aporhodopirellula aestuarii TaxID=2950107 RepID=A0ABT0U7A1_9BACT|nr:DUF4175 family protein [Aporhodopirellula aestuarii]MCM2372766.1 hypothetical protein [Aporhodopirellula aestuarii]